MVTAMLRLGLDDSPWQMLPSAASRHPRDLITPKMKQGTLLAFN